MATSQPAAPSSHQARRRQALAARAPSGQSSNGTSGKISRGPQAIFPDHDHQPA